MAKDDSGPASGPTDVSANAPAPAGQPNRSWGKRLVLWSAGLLALLVLGFGVLVALNINDSVKQDEAIAAGQCATASGFGSASADLVVAPCTDPAANYSVGARLPGGSASCPKGDYAVFQQTARIGGDFTLCLVPNWKAGECYLNTADSTTKIDCATSQGKDRIKVTKVYPGTSDERKCTKGGFVASFTRPALVLCYKNL